MLFKYAWQEIRGAKSVTSHHRIVAFSLGKQQQQTHHQKKPTKQQTNKIN